MNAMRVYFERVMVPSGIGLEWRHGQYIDQDVQRLWVNWQTAWNAALAHGVEGRKP